MSVSYATFRALYNYSPKERDEIELRVDDVILIKKPVNSEHLLTWLEGVNQRTQQCGQIPGPYLQELNIAGTVNFIKQVRMPFREFCFRVVLYQKA